MDSKPTMEINAVSASVKNYNGRPSSSGMMFQANGQNAAHRNMNADPLCIIDDAHFDLPQLYMQSTTETANSWYSSSCEDMERFDQLDHCNIYHPLSINAADNIMSVQQSRLTLCRQSAFGLYLRPAHSLCVNICKQDLMKRSFNFLRKIDEKRREAQRLSQAANIEEAHHYNNVSLQNKASFQHMLAERNRRVKLKQHFSFLHSLLPNNSKKDKYSVLANTTKYMTELKSRVDELEKRNRVLEESLRKNVSNKEGCSSLGLRGDEVLTTIVYSSDEVVLGRAKNIPNQLDIQINVQIDPLSSPTSLLILLLEQLKELQLEVVSVESNIQTFTLQAHLLIKQLEGDEWESSKWKSLAEVVRRTFI